MFILRWAIIFFTISFVRKDMTDFFFSKNFLYWPKNLFHLEKNTFCRRIVFILEKKRIFFVGETFFQKFGGRAFNIV